jgi:hypothetical protein
MSEVSADKPKPPLSDNEIALRRVARQEMEWLMDVDAAARHLDHLMTLGPEGLPRPVQLIEDVGARLQALSDRTDGHLLPRQRPKQKSNDRWSTNRPRALVSIDETGLTKGVDPAAPYFAAAAVIVEADHLSHVEEAVRGWQTRHFGEPRYVHELDIRKGTGAFYFGGDHAKRDQAASELKELLTELPYTVTAVAIDKERFGAVHPNGRVDEVLPNRLYPLVVNMLFERVVHCLWSMGDLKGDLEAEGIGEVEDAHLQQAVATLKLRGTRFQSEGWFRYQLADHVSFFGKVHNRPGLQLADWVVKPCADAARAARDPSMRTTSDCVPHAMWEAVRKHMYDGNQGREDTFGLKVYPGLSREERLWLFPDAAVDDLARWDPV